MTTAGSLQLEITYSNAIPATATQMFYNIRRLP
jgi:hypothetical protein